MTVLLGTLQPTCSRPADGDAAPQGAIAIGGCHSLGRGALCELTDVSRELRFWLPDSAATLELEQDGVWRESPGTTLLDGRLFRVALPPPARGLRVRAAFRGTARHLQLELQTRPSWPWSGEIEQLDAPQRAAHIDALLASASGAERARLLYESAWTLSGLGQPELAVSRAREAAEGSEQAGRYGEARHQWLYVAYLQSHRHDFGAAAQALDRAAAVPAPVEGVTDADGQALALYSRGVYFGELGDTRRASRAHAEAKDWAERAGAEALLPRILAAQAFVLQQQGRLSLALDLQRSQLNTPLAASDGCFRARLLSNLGWTELEAAWEAEHHPGLLTQASDHIGEAVAAYASACRDAPAEHRRHAQLNLAWVALQRGDRALAERLLSVLEDLRSQPRLWLWRQLLAAELQLEAGHAEAALAEFDALAVFAQKHLTPELEWQALSGAAGASRRLRRDEKAVELYARAEALLDTAAWHVPIEQGRLRFNARRNPSARGLVTTLMSLGRARAAFDAARRARRRVLVDLALGWASPPPGGEQSWGEARSRFLELRRELDQALVSLSIVPRDELAAAEERANALRRSAERALDDLALERRRAAPEMLGALRDPEPDEALLMWFEAEDGWYGFMSLGSELHWVKRPAPPRGEAALAPFAVPLAHARRLTLLETEAFHGSDVHAGTSGALPASKRLEIAYSLDLPDRSLPRVSAGHHVVAGDAQGDLPHARVETQRVAELIRHAGKQATVLVGTALTPQALLKSASGARVLHYAGHARFSGEEGWESELTLAGGQLGIGDVLTWLEPPATVVLSACEASASPAIAPGQGIGLAAAFLLAGSSMVVAPARRVSDEQSLRFSLALTERLAAGQTLPDAYRSALLGATEQDVDWSAYRLLIR